MNALDLVVRFAGEAGDGIITLGDMFVKACVRTGLDAMTSRSYPTEVRGGNVMYQARVATRDVYFSGDRPDILAAFNKKDMQTHIVYLDPKGTLLIDSDAGSPEGFEGEVLPVPLRTLSQRFGLDRRNVVLLGILARYLGMDDGIFLALMREKFGGREEILRLDLDAFSAGWVYCGQMGWRYEEKISTVPDAPQRLLVSGNEAIAIGAIAAGCRFFAGYPITPASEILEYLSETLPRFNGNVLQVEDELAALASVIGASFSGTKAMTATSGPGFSLMGELIGYAGMAEIPCVIVDAQRVGPSTGIPTATEQSDLLLSIHASHGESPRIVLAPSTVEECFYLTMEAFNLAERFQMPVILLSDLSLSHRLEAVEKLDASKVKIVDRLRPTIESVQDYERFKDTEDGVSPMAVPGGDGLYPAMGIEHNERGFPNYTIDNRIKMVGKRFRKLNGVEAGRFTRTFGDPKASVGIIGWGSTEGALFEAVEFLAKDGLPLHVLQLKMLWPLPTEEIKRFAEGKKMIIVVELNRTAQCANLLRSELLIEPKSINKYVGLPFTKAELVTKIREVVQGA